MKKKKIIATTLLVAILMATFCFSKIETSKLRTISGTFYTGSWYDFIETNDGHIWEVTDIDLNNGTKVNVTFGTCHTKNVKDDKVVKILQIENKNSRN